MDFQETQQQHAARASSFGHTPPPQMQQMDHTQQLPRPSPFASSGPVAMVNQIRPGAPGQFPGVAVRTNPTQLATPLVPTRRLSGATAPQQHQSHAVSATPATPLASNELSRDLLFPSPPTSTTSSASALFDQLQRPTARAIPPPAHSINRYHSMDHITGNYGALDAQTTVTATADLFPRVERSSATTLVSASPTAPPTRVFNENFGFSQPPPPAAPFLGYADSSRTQSASSMSSTAPSPRVSLHQRTSSGTLSTGTPSPRIHAQVRTADDLLEEFLHVSVEDQYLGGASGSEGPLFPACSSSTVPPASRLTLADVPDTIEGLEELYRQKRWKTLTKKSLSMLQNPSNDAPLTLEIKSWWLAGLIKDGHYDNATSVLDQIGDLDDPTLSSSIPDAFVIMRLRLLEAMLHKYKGNAAEHEKKLFQLITRIRDATTQGTTSETLGCSTETAWKWLRVAQFALVNHLVLQNKFSLALRVSATIDIDHLEEFESVIVLSRLGRMHLQMGDLTNAEQLFRLARSLAEKGARSQLESCVDASTGELTGQLQERLLVNDGLILFAQNKLQEALGAFDAALNLEVSRARQGDLVGTDFAINLLLEEDLVCVAVNNFAICALYCCDVKGAVAALERMIRSDPVRFVNAIVVFNLSSLYDLIYDNATSVSRKEMIKKLAEMYDLEHVDAAAFRI